MNAPSPTLAPGLISIDQNCHPLWDAVAKLAALASGGYTVTHFVEDIDVAFTSMGAGVGADTLHLARERFHRSGGQDWGAAMFYSEFLSRLPVEIRDWEPVTGLKTNVLAKKLGRSVDDLYDEFSPGDNWQLIGPSYVGDRRHHRVVGDLTMAETGQFLRQLMDKAKGDMLRAFPEKAPQQRIVTWFSREEGLLDRLLADHANGRLVELYRDWLGESLGQSVDVAFASDLLACRGDLVGRELLDLFCRGYDRAAGLYNQAVAESASPIRPLKTADGELPFFATFQRHGHSVRTGLALSGRLLWVGEQSFPLEPDGTCPLDQMASAGIQTVAGKALALVVQVRLGRSGRPLALPHGGSLYMSASNAFAEKLAADGLITPPFQPVVRVRFHLLDRMRSVDTIIRLPKHLAAYFGRDEVPAGELGRNYADLASQAARRLEAIKDDSARQQWQKETFPTVFTEIDALDGRRRQLARDAPKSQEIRDIWKQIKALQTDLLSGTLRQIASDYHLRDIDYWDSRGAIIPWSHALGGEAFYNGLIAEAEVYPEPLPKAFSNG